MTSGYRCLLQNILLFPRTSLRKMKLRVTQHPLTPTSRRKVVPSREARYNNQYGSRGSYIRNCEHGENLKNRYNSTILPEKINTSFLNTILQSLSFVLEKNCHFLMKEKLFTMHTIIIINNTNININTILKL